MRPSEVPEWMANHRKPGGLELVPWECGKKKGKISSFGRKMREWWIALQPDCRGGEWPLVRDVPDDADWTELKKGGSTGFVLLVIGLNWWVRHARSSKDQNEAASVVEDVVFVLGKILKSTDEQMAEPSKKKKKSVTTIC